MRAPILTTFGAVVVFGFMFAVASADVGDVLLEYRSDTGKLPEDFGWEHEGNCLKPGCPFPLDYHDPEPLPEDDSVVPCHFQGGCDWSPADGLPDNDYTIRTPPAKKGRGAHINYTHPESGANHNAPAALFDGWHWNFGKHESGLENTCAYSEWITFDDGDGTLLVHPETKNGFDPTPYGAQNFPGAPANPMLRLVGGDGNGNVDSLDDVLPQFDRLVNVGKVRFKKSHSHNGTITVVFRGALSRKGTFDREDTFLEVRATKSDLSEHIRVHFVHFTDNALPPGCTDCGRIGVRSDSSGEVELIGHPDTGWTAAPETFFTLRAVINPDTETVAVILNEGTAEERETVLPPGFLGGTPAGWERRTGANYQTAVGLWSDGDYVVWVDYVEVLEGAVVLGPCGYPNPVFDLVTSEGNPGPDGAVDEMDYEVFESCATGPAPSPAVFEALSDDCKCLDVNEDEAIDQEDFGVFQGCFSGTGQTVDPACDD